MRRMMLGLAATLVAGAGLAYGQERTGISIPSALPPQTNAYGSVYAGTPAEGNPPAVQPGAGSPASTCLGCQQQECCNWRVHGWMAADFLMFFPQSQPIPANLITFPNRAPVVSKGYNYGIEYGFRVEFGLWLNSEESLGAQSLVDQLFRKTVATTVAGPVNLNTAIAGVATPIPVTGLTFQSWTQFNRVDGSTLFRIRCNDHTRVYGIFGTKFVVMEEDVSLNYTFAGGPVFEDFHSRNNFYGGQVGVLVTHNAGRLDFDAAAKVGLGGDYYNTTILGRNASNIPTQAFTNDANIGFYENTVFSVVPEFNGNVSYRLTDHISVRAGYTFLAFTNMQRPGAQIVQNIAPGIASPHTAPTFPGVRDTFIIHGLNFGAVLRY